MLLRHSKATHTAHPKNKGFNWSTECDKCLHMLKDYLQEAPILRYLVPTADYILHTDALKYTYAEVLT